jgi:co-chaperonin GroES (HSP10)
MEKSQKIGVKKIKKVPFGELLIVSSLIFYLCQQKKLITMSLIIEEKDLEKFILIGDRVLIRPKNPQGKTASGLYLPPTVQENEKTHSGYIVKVGPGYPIPTTTDLEETWKEKKEQVQYVPLQAKAGDLAVYLNKSGWEIEFNKEKYIILPHSSILMLIRDEGMFG